MVKVSKKRVSKKRSAKKVSKPKESNSSGRKIIHSSVSVELCNGKTAITIQKAQDLLGWEEETKEAPFKQDFLLKDLNGQKVRCYNNTTNRPISKPNLKSLKQEILRGRWQLNGEPIIIGKTGLILNGQHSLLAFIEAVQEYRSKPEEFTTHTEEPTLDKLIVFGIEETDSVVNTMDTCKPRSLADVIFRSHFFSSMQPKERNAISRRLDYAVKLLWERTGVTADAFALRRTHSESLDFIERHPKLIECTKHIFEEDGKVGNIGRYISPGYAVALLYMTGSCTSDPTEYRANRNESVLDWDMFDKACDFWVCLGGKASEFTPIHKVLQSMLEKSENVTPRERWSLLIKAWNLYVADEPLTTKAIALEYDIDKDGINRLAEQPTIGGIDCDGDFVDPTPSEIRERSQTVKAKKGNSDKPKAKLSDDFVIGDLVRVGRGKGSWKGELLEMLGHNTKIRVGQGYQGCGTVKDAELADLARV